MKDERKTKRRLLDELKNLLGKVAQLEASETKRKPTEEKYSTIIQTAPDGFKIIDLKGRYLAVNDSYCRMVGYTREELLQMFISDVEAKEAPEETARHIKHILEHGSDRFETRHRGKDGKIIDLEVSATYSAEDGGELIVFSRDITERKQAETAVRQALAETQQRRAEIAALAECRRTVLEQEEFAIAVEIIYRVCKNLLGASAGFIARWQPDGKLQEVLVQDPGELDWNPPAALQGLPAAVFAERLTRYENQLSPDPDPGIAPAGRPAPANVIFAPLLIAGKSAGLLGLANKPGGFDDNDAHFAMAFGELCAIALVKSRSLLALRQSEERYRLMVENSPDAVLVNVAGHYAYANAAAVKLLGAKSEQEIVGRDAMDFIPEPDRELVRARQWAALEERKIAPPRRGEFQRLDGTRLPVQITGIPIIFQGQPAAQVVLHDLTERKQAEKRDRLAREVLDLLNRHERSSDLVRDILLLVKKDTGFEAVGIRLQEGEDFPYYETNGFAEDFLRAERFLCERDETGKIVRDGKGNAVLECMCGNIIRGRTNPSLPFFTEGGSFWTNSTTELLATTTEEERQGRTRNRCNREGYESMALIPLRAEGKIIGLLQLNDSRLNGFTKEMIYFFGSSRESVGINEGLPRSKDGFSQA